MKLQLIDSYLKIKFEWCEQILAFSSLSTITIPLSHIINVTNQASDVNNYALRMPGTYIPFILKAGTFYTSMGREFWWIVQNSKDFIVLTLQDEEFVRIIITVQDSQEWTLRINTAIL